MPQVEEVHGRCVKSDRLESLTNSHPTAFICRPITTCRATLGFCCVTSRSSGDTHRETVLLLAHVDAFRTGGIFGPCFDRADRHEAEVGHPWVLDVGLVSTHPFPDQPVPINFIPEIVITPPHPTFSFVVIKIIMGVRLLGYATKRRAGMEHRKADDKINDFGRDPIGEGGEERVYNRELKTYLDNQMDNAAAVAEIGENREKTGNKGEKNGGGGDGGAGGGKKRLELEDITRFTMVKRIW